MRYEQMIEYRDNIINDSGKTFNKDAYIEIVKSVCVIQTDNGSFIDPNYKRVLEVMNLSPEYCEDEISYSEIKEILELEKDRLNILFSPINAVFKFIKDVGDNITAEEAKKILEERSKESDKQS